MERLAGIDASFLYLETPQVHMHIGFACVLESRGPDGYDLDGVMRHVRERTSCHSVFRRRLIRVPFDLHHPLWIEDPNFDLIHHLRRVALPAPGGPEEFAAMVGRISSTPLDRSRPLWEAWVIEGLADGRLGLMLKMHHAVVDGVSGAGLLTHLFDDSPTTIAPPRPRPPEPERVPNDGELVIHALRSRLKQPFEIAKVVTHTLANLGGILHDQVQRKQQPAVRPLGAPHTHFNRSVSPRRNLATMRIPLGKVRRIKAELGCTVNDVVLAVAGGGLRGYLVQRDALPEVSLTAACPVSVRSKTELDQYNNKVSVVWTELATDTGDPLERVERIHRRMAAAKRELQAMGEDMLERWAELAGPRVFNLGVRAYSRQHLADLHRPIHNLVISNVPGPRTPLYLAGHQLRAVYPMGPVMEGAGLNLTVMSYCDSVDFGFFVDSELVPDVWDLAAATQQAFTELCDAVAGFARQRAEI